MKMTTSEVIAAALDMMEEEGEEDGRMVLELTARLVLNDWTGTGVYETLKMSMDAAETAEYPLKVEDDDETLIFDEATAAVNPDR